LPEKTEKGRQKRRGGRVLVKTVHFNWEKGTGGGGGILHGGGLSLENEKVTTTKHAGGTGGTR